MSIRRAPPSALAAQQRCAPADVGALTRSFADILRAGPVTPLRSPTALLPVASAVEAHPPKRRPNARGHASDTWDAMRDYVMRCVLSVRNSGAPCGFPYKTPEDVWSALTVGANTALHDQSLAPYAALMALREYEDNTAYGEPYQFMMRPSDNQSPGRFILCEDRSPNTPSGQEKTMWYFEIDSLTIDGRYVEYPAGEHFISLGVTLRPANKEWDDHTLLRRYTEGDAKGYTDDYGYSKDERGNEEKHVYANRPRRTRLEINHATDTDAKPKTQGVRRVVINAGFEWMEELEKIMQPESRSGLASLIGKPNAPLLPYPLIPTGKRSPFWLSSIAHPPARGERAFSTVLVDALSDAIMHAITQKVSATWPNSVGEWLRDTKDAQRIRKARAAAAGPGQPRLPPRFYDEDMENEHIKGGEELAAEDVDDKPYDPKRPGNN